MKVKASGLIISILAVAAALVLLIGDDGFCASRTIRIGHIVHMTGAYAAGQVGINEGFLDGVEAANLHMKLPAGVRFEGAWMDGGTDTSKSMTAFKKLTGGDNPVVLIIGESTPVALALKKWFIKKQIPSLEGGSGQELFNLPSWTFSVPSPYVNELGAWIDFYTKEVWPKKGLKRAPRFAWLTWDIAPGRAQITDEAKAYLTSKGVEIVGEEFIPVVPTDVSAQILRLKEKKVDFTYGLMYYNALAVVMKEFDRQGLIDQVDVGMTYAFQPQIFMKTVGNLSRNVYVTALSPPLESWGQVCPPVLEMWKKNRREGLPSPDLYLFGFNKALVACEAIRLALEKTGPDKLNGQAVFAALKGMKSYDMWGAGNAVSFGEKKRYGQDSVSLIRLDDAKLKVLGEYPTPNLTKYNWEK